MKKHTGAPRKIIYMCTGDDCKKQGGKQIGKFLKGKIKGEGLKGEVEVVKTSCTDRCDDGPILCVQPDNEWYTQSTEETAEKIWKEKILNNNQQE